MAIGSSPVKLVTRDGWRFSLRTLLILLFIAALPLAIVSHWRSGKLREHAAAKRLRELGLVVKMRRPDVSPGSKAAAEPWYALLLPPDHTNLVIWVRVPSGQRLDAEAVRLLHDLPHLMRLDLQGQNELPDISLQPLRSLPQLEILMLACPAKTLPHFSYQRNLRELYLSGADITDSCAQLLQNNPHLTAVSLHDTSTSDALPPQLARLEQLEFLQLDNANISSAGVSQLTPLKKLQQLLLASTEIDDAAIPAIAQLKSLRFLSVHNTRISDDGREQLRRALPGCKVQ